MGFWQVMGKMIQGKPVFEAPPDTTTQAATPPAATQPKPTPTMPTNNDRKVIPELSIQHCKTHHSGTSFEVTAWITNASSVEIELDKVVILGQTTQLDRRLSPQQSHEVRLYHGAAPTDDSNYRAYFYYQDFRANDYFCADFIVEYQQQHDGTYTVEDLHPENYGVRDI